MSPAGASSLALLEQWHMGKNPSEGQDVLGAVKAITKEQLHGLAKVETESRGFPAQKFPFVPWQAPGQRVPEPRPRATVTTAALALGHARAPGTIPHPSCFRTPLRPRDCPPHRASACFHSRQPWGCSPGAAPLGHVSSKSFKLAAAFVNTGR